MTDLGESSLAFVGVRSREVAVVAAFAPSPNAIPDEVQRFVAGALSR
jgi:hypothetical protein